MYLCMYKKNIYFFVTYKIEFKSLRGLLPQCYTKDVKLDVICSDGKGTFATFTVLPISGKEVGYIQLRKGKALSPTECDAA